MTRPSTWINLLLVALYGLLVASLVLWSHAELSDGAEALAEETVRVAGQLVGTAVPPELVADALDGDARARREVDEGLAQLTERSSLVTVTVLLAADGTVVAHHGAMAGTEPPRFLTALPETDPSGDPSVSDLGDGVVLSRPESGTTSAPTAEGDAAEGIGSTHWLLTMPIQPAADAAPVAWLRLGLAAETIEGLFEARRQRLFIAFVVTLIALGGLGLLLHLQLRRRGRDLVTALQAALDGEPSEKEVDRRDAFSDAIEAAGRLGRALSQERRRSAQAEERLERVASLTDVGLVVLDENFEPELTGEQAERLLGFDPAREPERWGSIRDQLQEAVDRIEDEAAGDGSRPTSIEVRLVTDEAALEESGSAPDADQGRPCHLYPLGTEAENGSLAGLWEAGPDAAHGYLLVFQNREAMAMLEDELRSAARLRTLNRLYMGIAHDLRAPMNALALNLELLRRSLDDGDERRERVALIERELERLEHHLGLLLGQVVPSGDGERRFDLGSLAEDLGRLIEPQARRQGSSLRVVTPDEPVEVEAHRDALRQATLSVAINALEAMEGDDDGVRSTLTLEVSRELRDGNGDSDGDGDGDQPWAVLRVCDTGPGIPEDVRDRVFDLRFTTKDSGSGLGLAVGRSILATLGGRLDLEETGPRGSVFALALPAAGDDERDLDSGDEDDETLLPPPETPSPPSDPRPAP